VITNVGEAGSHAYVVPKEGPYQAQHGEDRWLEAFFNGKRDGFFVEVGAYDGIVLSNSYYFETIGWRGVLVEPDPDKAAMCRSNRAHSKVFECAAVASPAVKEVLFHAVENGQVYSTINMTDEHRRRLGEYGLVFKETRVAAQTLDSILAEAAGAHAIDFVTIDVEEGEMEVLRGFDIQRWRPGVVMVETNSRFRSHEIRRYFVERGYIFHYSIGINDVYVPFRYQPMAAVVDTASYLLHRASKSLRYRLKGLLRR
jgi:FkbM family methyltransferase